MYSKNSKYTTNFTFLVLRTPSKCKLLIEIYFINQLLDK